MRLQAIFVGWLLLLKSSYATAVRVMPSRVLVSDPISEKGVELLNAHPDITADFKVGLAPEELLSIIGEYDALIVRSQTKVTPEVFAAASKLKAVGRAGVGVDNINRDCCQLSWSHRNEHSDRQHHFNRRARLHLDVCNRSEYRAGPRRCDRWKLQVSPQGLSRD